MKSTSKTAIVDLAVHTNEYLKTPTPALAAATNLAREDMGVLKRLRVDSFKGADTLNSFLSDNKMAVQPSRGAAFALNIIFHMFVLFFALTFLYVAVISPLETRQLQKEVDEKLTEGMLNTLESLDPKTKVAFVQALKAGAPLLQKARTMYTGGDTARATHNSTVFGNAWTVVAGLGIIFLVVVCVIAASKVRVGHMLAHIFAENAIIFAIIGIVEFSFFTLVAKKFVPVMPSQLGANALDAAKQAFATP
jgi:hypothetical protein